MLVSNVQCANMQCAKCKMQCAYVGGSEAVTASSMCKCVDVSICTMYNFQCVDVSICNMLVCSVQWTKFSVLMWEGLRPVTASSMCQFWGEGGVLASLNCPPLQCFEMLTLLCIALLTAIHLTVNCHAF